MNPLRTGSRLKSSLRLIAATGLAAALGASLLLAGPAQAANFRPLPEASLANSSLTLADLPRWMTRNGAPTLTQTYERGRRPSQADLCINANGDSVLGPRPRQYMGSMAITRVDEVNLGGTEVNSDIYQYANRKAAIRAWKKLNARAKTCAGLIDIDINEGDTAVRLTVQTDVTPLPVLFGRPGLAFTQDVSLEIIEGELDIAVLGDQYANYYLAGPAIIRVEIANINGASPGRISRIHRKFIENVSLVVAQRIQLRSQR